MRSFKSSFDLGIILAQAIPLSGAGHLLRWLPPLIRSVVFIVPPFLHVVWFPSPAVSRQNKYPPAEPEVLRLLAPQRGLTAIG